MSEVFKFAPRYLAGLVSTHRWMRSRHLCQTPLNGGEAYPVRTWLLSWTRAIQIQNIPAIGTSQMCFYSATCVHMCAVTAVTYGMHAISARFLIEVQVVQQILPQITVFYYVLGRSSSALWCTFASLLCLMACSH